jgi:hypothetical protein
LGDGSGNHWRGKLASGSVGGRVENDAERLSHLSDGEMKAVREQGFPMVGVVESGDRGQGGCENVEDGMVVVGRVDVGRLGEVELVDKLVQGGDDVVCTRECVDKNIDPLQDSQKSNMWREQGRTSWLSVRAWKLIEFHPETTGLRAVTIASLSFPSATTVPGKTEE